MRNNEGPKSPRLARTNGFIPNSFRALSSYLRIVSSGASTVARSAASVASSIVDRDDDGAHDQVLWAGFDNLMVDRGARRVLLLGYRSGFQVWDVEEADNVQDIVSRHDGPSSFMQMVPNPGFLKKGEDKFADSRPLLVVCADSSGGTNNFQDGFTTHSNGNIPAIHNDPGNVMFFPTIVRFYSLRSHSYIHVLKFRSVIYSVRCSSRVVAIAQAAQIHCLDAATLETTYTIVTNPIDVGSLNAGGCMGYGPLAVGHRWVAYSGTAISDTNLGRCIPKHFSSSASFSSFPPSRSLVAQYAKESSKQLAAGILNLGDKGYKKLSRYCSELRPDNSFLQLEDSGWKVANGHMHDEDNVGMVVIRDIVSKAVVAQFRAHKSPISALCFDPSGTLLVTASIQGHNINVFKIMPGCFEGGKSYMHLYQLQRGLTNAVIRDISFSDDSKWIMISSSRGTSHLFYINPQGGPVNFNFPASGFKAKNDGISCACTYVNRSADPELQISRQNLHYATGPPITLSAVSRIRSGNSGWRGTVSGAAAAATGRLSSYSGAVASVFHDCIWTENLGDLNAEGAKFHLLVFNPSGAMTQYALRIPNGGLEPMIGLDDGSYESASDSDGKLLVEAIQKWNVCQKQNRREREESFDGYGEHIGNIKKIYPEGIIQRNLSFQGTGKQSSKKSSGDGQHRLYISEAELHLHPAQIPLWAKPRICFQSMTLEGIETDNPSNFGGEIQIEKIPTCTREARSKDLVPVFDNLQAPKNHVRVLKSERAKLSWGISPHNGIEETALDSHLMPPPEEIKCDELVKDSAKANPESRHDTAVNNREKSEPQVSLKSVNSNEGCMAMDNLFYENDDIFD